MKTLVMIEYYYANQTKPRTLAFVVPKNDEMLEEAIKIADDQNEKIRLGTWKNAERGGVVYEVVDLSQQDVMQIMQAMKRHSSTPGNFNTKKSKFGFAVAVHNPDLMVGNTNIMRRLTVKLEEKKPIEAMVEVLSMFCSEESCAECKTGVDKCLCTKLDCLITKNRKEQ